MSNNIVQLFYFGRHQQLYVPSGMAYFSRFEDVRLVIPALLFDDVDDDDDLDGEPLSPVPSAHVCARHDIGVHGGKDDTCCVCLDALCLPDAPCTQFACHHVLHTACWNDVTKTAKRVGSALQCPLCRAPLTAAGCLQNKPCVAFTDEP
jgi:hypothetical protein